MVKGSNLCVCLVLGLVLLGLLPGCHTEAHLIYTPTQEKDLILSEEELTLKFLDIDRYKEGGFPFFSFYKMPPVNELKYACNFFHCDERSLSWWNLCPFFVFPLPLFPVEHRMWERGEFRFNVTVSRPFLFGWKPHIWYWEIEPIYDPYLLEEPSMDSRP